MVDGRNLNYVTISDGKHVLWQQALDDSPPVMAGELEDSEVLSITPLENGAYTYITGKWRYDVMLLRGLG